MCQVIGADLIILNHENNVYISRLFIMQMEILIRHQQELMTITIDQMIYSYMYFTLTKPKNTQKPSLFTHTHRSTCVSS